MIFTICDSDIPIYKLNKPPRIKMIPMIEGGLILNVLYLTLIKSKISAPIRNAIIKKQF